MKREKVADIKKRVFYRKLNFNESRGCHDCAFSKERPLYYSFDCEMNGFVCNIKFACDEYESKEEG